MARTTTQSKVETEIFETNTTRIVAVMCVYLTSCAIIIAYPEIKHRHQISPSAVADGVHRNV